MFRLRSEWKDGRGRSETEAARCLWGEWRRSLVGFGTASVVSLSGAEGVVHVFLTDESLHGAVDLVSINRYGRLFVLGVVCLVGYYVADLSHVLGRVRIGAARKSGNLTSTCSLDQLSMLKDLTLEMWVPNLRWIAAQRMQRKMPNCSRQSVSANFDSEPGKAYTP